MTVQINNAIMCTVKRPLLNSEHLPITTVELGYNDHGYNEFTVITYEFNYTFLDPNDSFTT